MSSHPRRQTVVQSTHRVHDDQLPALHPGKHPSRRWATSSPRLDVSTIRSRRRFPSSNPIRPIINNCTPYDSPSIASRRI